MVKYKLSPKNQRRDGLRFGLCCIFRNEPIKFRTTTAKAVSRLTRRERLDKLSDLCLSNAENLLKALMAVDRLGIGAFRINSQFFPLYTHPEAGYELGDLKDRNDISLLLHQVDDFRKKRHLRLSFHPDQFIVLNSPRADVVENSIRELAYQAMVATLVGADVINIHLGGVYGDKTRAIERFVENAGRLPEEIRSRLTVENDDRSHTPSDIVPVCERLTIPLVYDVHHHRCNPDAWSIEKATEACVKTWDKVGREPYFHVSSPKDGWEAANPRPHADYIDVADLPTCWMTLDATVDVEAKAKELAVERLIASLKEAVVSE